MCLAYLPCDGLSQQPCLHIIHPHVPRHTHSHALKAPWNMMSCLSGHPSL